MDGGSYIVQETGIKPFPWKRNEKKAKQLSGRKNFPPYLSWVLAAGPIMKLTQDRLTGGKENSLNGEHKGLIEMVPTKWPKQTAFILFSP